MSSVSLSEPVLAGREHELAELRGCLESARKGNGATVFVSGEAGNGKTRLASEFLRIAKRTDVNILSGWCLSNVAVPYFPFLEAIESFSTGESAIGTLGTQQLRMKSWLTEPNTARGLETQDALSPQTWSDQTFAVVTRELLSMSSSRPTILFIDDIHWADSASLSLLHYIAREIGTERILVLATYRSEEIAASQDGQPHPLLDTLRLMGREGIFKDIQLQNLTRTEVGTIAESMLGGIVKGDLVERLAAESRGIPLFVVESLRMLYAQGSLVRENGQWQLNVDRFDVPDKVKNVILRRLDSLKPSQRRILDAASAVGERFDPRLVAAVVAQDNLDVLESLNVIARSTLLVRYEADYYRFVHAKFREMLYDQISVPLKKEYHSRIADKLESLTLELTKHIPVSDLAYHYSQAGNVEKSVRYSLAAGKDSLLRFSNKEALAHYSYVLRTISEDPEYLHEKVAALEGLGEAFFAASMFKEATRTFVQLGDVSTGLVKLRALRRAMDAAFFQGEFAYLLELTKKAEPLADIDRLEKGRILMNKARAVLFLGNSSAGFQNFEAALRIFQEEFSLPDIARTMLGLGGGADEIGLVRALRAVALYDELGDARGLMDACNRAGQSFGYRMLKKEALGMFEKAVIIGEKIGDFNRLAEAYVSSSWLFETENNPNEALARSLKALEYSEKTDSDWVHGMTYSNLVRQYAWVGDLEHSETYFAKLIKLPPQVLSSFGFVKFPISRAILSAAKSEWSEANRYFDEVLKSIAVPNPSHEIELRNAYAWVLNRQKRVEEARIQIEAARKFLEETVDHFGHSIVRAILMAPKQVEAGKDFVIRIDVTNASRKASALNCIERLIPAGFRVTGMPAFCSFQNDTLSIQERRLEPFQVETFNISLQANKSGSFAFGPQVVYSDDSGKTQKYEINPVKVAVWSTTSALKFESVAGNEPARIEFRSEAAQKAFDYLVRAFVEDWKRLRMPTERSGWRTLMDIAKQGSISKYSVYGAGGDRGRAIHEMEHLGLVEVRVFTGERGRGGNVFKVRVVYEDPTVRRQIETGDK